MGERVGYARVSTTGQSLDAQIEKLVEKGCESQHIFTEKASGAKGKNRPALEDMLRFVRRGDTLVVTKLDRLARSVSELTRIAQQLQGKSVDLMVIDQQIDTSTPTGRLTFHLLGAIGEFERDLINDRTAEGRARAMANGVKFGRSRSLSESQIAALVSEIDSGVIPKTELAKKYKIGTTTLYRVYNEAARAATEAN